MNCLIFPTPPPFKLAPDSPKLEHVEKVLKAADGGTVFAGQANGGLFVCKFEKLADGGATLTPISDAPNPAPLAASVAVAFARPQIAQRMLFEAACFGVENLLFYAASKGEADYAKSGLYARGEYAKWLEKGAEQACATSIPSFSTAASLAEAVEMLDALAPRDSLKIAPDLYEATAYLPDVLDKSPDLHVKGILGSERGFSNPDRDLLRLNNYTLVSLGNRVLRTDTALIATLSRAGCSLHGTELRSFL